MKLKQYCRYLVDFNSKWVEACSILMGLSFFACLVHYFAIVSIRDVGAVELIFALLMGIILCGGFVVCLACLHLNAPGLYALIGAIQCLCILILSFTSGDALRIVLSLLWYVFAALVLLATAGGYLPGRLLASFVFFLPVVVRILFYGIGALSLLDWTRELTVLCTLAGNGCLAMGFYPVNRTRE